MLVRKATSKLCKKPSKVERLTLTGLEQNIIIRYNNYYYNTCDQCAIIIANSLHAKLSICDTAPSNTV